MDQNHDAAGASYGNDGLSLAMAYVIMQPEITGVYSPEDALRQGTLFPELDKPFLGYGGVS